MLAFPGSNPARQASAGVSAKLKVYSNQEHSGSHLLLVSLRPEPTERPANAAAVPDPVILLVIP